MDEAKLWRYSSARNYEGIEGLVEIEHFQYTTRKVKKGMIR
ncbi:hypothetical protein [Sulfurovum sp. TSL1]|nr:hypothetical protein [Sulfurovum sp. TSL1]